jgi:acetyl esterase/lipase
MFKRSNRIFKKGVVFGLGLAAIFWVVFYSVFVMLVDDSSQSTVSITLDQQGTIHTANGVLPIAQSLSSEAKDAMREQLNTGFVSFFVDCNPAGDWTDPRFLLALRQCVVEAKNYPEIVSNLHEIYPNVLVERTNINGIEVDIATPKDGVSDRNRDRVLLYLHESSAVVDHPDIRKLEAIPIASLGKIKVIGVDYRMMPEGTHLDALADVTVVYSEILKAYRSENIGLFGCSQGAIINASMIPWLDRQGLPGPGALSLSGETGNREMTDSDYVNIAFGLHGLFPPIVQPIEPDEIFKRGLPYYDGVDPNDPVTQPTLHPDAMALFPPTILLNAIRDSPSRAARDHRALLRNGVESELHIWEGLPHCFQNIFPRIPESQEHFEQILKFFDKHLGIFPLKH